MIMKMTKEQFIESMQNAKESEKAQEIKPIKIEKQVKEAIRDNTGADIIRLTEPARKRGRKPRTKEQIKIPTSWRESMKAGIEQMLSESAEKTDQAKALIEEAEELITQAETIGGMIK